MTWILGLLSLLVASPLQVDENRAVLNRDPLALEAAVAGRWSGWKPGDAPPDALLNDYRAALEAYQQSRLLSCLSHIYRVLEIEADYPPGLLLAAVSLYRLQRYGGAIELYERLLAHVPGEIARTRQLGHCYHSLGRSEQALVHYDKLLALAPTDLLARRARGVVRLRTGRVGAALEDFDSVLAQRPADAECLYWRAAALYDDESPEALAAARLARDRGPFSARAWFLVAQAAGEAGEADEAQVARERHKELAAVESALRPLEDRLRVQPGDLEALESVARLRLAAGDFRAAKRAYEGLLAAAEAAGAQAVADRARRGLQAQATLNR